MAGQPSTAGVSPSATQGLDFRNPPCIDYALEQQKTISIAHPTWPENHDVYLTLNALDDWENGGSHFNTVWLACALVTGNSFNGHLSGPRDPMGESLNIGADDLLKEGKYWFHVPDPRLNPSTPALFPYLYPIFRDFRHWEYPPGRVPKFWQHPTGRTKERLACSSTSAAVHGDDLFCRVTGHWSGTHSAHICPLSEQPWFTK